MPTGTGKFTGNGLLNLLDGDSLFPVDDWHFTLLTSAGSVNIDTVDFWDDLVANEETGINWSAGGVVCDGEALSLVTANDDVEFDITDEVVSTVTLDDGKTLVLVSFTNGTNATREVAGYATMDTPLAPQGGNLTIDLASTGFALIDYA